ncbi:hypothetical protein GOBAR_DD07413 [Gossypium barbadense]|nr:hypothetical protein GOBAR_DD07413 [Gossypium barbadense]
MSDKTYIRDTPSKVWNCAVIVFKKAKFESFSRSSYSLVPGSGMNRWLTVGLFGRYPAYGYCPKLTAASKAEAIHMMMVHAWKEQYPVTQVSMVDQISNPSAAYG